MEKNESVSIDDKRVREITLREVFGTRENVRHREINRRNSE